MVCPVLTPMTWYEQGENHRWLYGYIAIQYNKQIKFQKQSRYTFVFLSSTFMTEHKHNMIKTALTALERSTLSIWGETGLSVSQTSTYTKINHTPNTRLKWSQSNEPKETENKNMNTIMWRLILILHA